MPAPYTDTGHGATIAFGTSTYTCSRIRIRPGSGYEIPVVRLPHLALSDGVNIPGMMGDLATPDDFEVETYRDGSLTQQPPRRVTETFTVTYPIPSGLTNGATEVFSGTVTRVAQGELASNNPNTQTMTIAVLGTITTTAAS